MTEDSQSFDTYHGYAFAGVAMFLFMEGVIA